MSPRGEVGVVVFGAKKMKYDSILIFGKNQLELKDKDWKEKDAIGKILKNGNTYLGKLNENYRSDLIQDKINYSTISEDSDSSGSEVPKKNVLLGLSRNVPSQSNLGSENVHTNGSVVGVTAVGGGAGVTVGQGVGVGGGVGDVTVRAGGNGSAGVGGSVGVVEEINGSTNSNANSNDEKDVMRYSGPVVVSVSSEGSDKLINVSVVIVDNTSTRDYNREIKDSKDSKDCKDGKDSNKNGVKEGIKEIDISRHKEISKKDIKNKEIEAHRIIEKEMEREPFSDREKENERVNENGQGKEDGRENENGKENGREKDKINHNLSDGATDSPSTSSEDTNGVSEGEI